MGTLPKLDDIAVYGRKTMAQKNAHLLVHGQGEVEVEFVARYLSDLTSAYNSIFLFASLVDSMNRTAHEFHIRPYPFALFPLLNAPSWTLPSKRPFGARREWLFSSNDASLLIPRDSQLVLASVRLASPGLWDFLGKLNPLEVLRQYLNDRHERRKDHNYRESAEERRLQLENLDRENQVIAGRIKIAKELGATDQDLAPILEALIHRPLMALDKHQDRNVIEGAEIMELPPKRDDEVDLS
jgi:hypothetical protein